MSVVAAAQFSTLRFKRTLPSEWQVDAIRAGQVAREGDELAEVAEPDSNAVEEARKAAEAVLGLTASGAPDTIESLNDVGLVHVLFDAIECNDDKLRSSALFSLLELFAWVRCLLSCASVVRSSCCRRSFCCCFLLLCFPASHPGRPLRLWLLESDSGRSLSW